MDRQTTRSSGQHRSLVRRSSVNSSWLNVFDPASLDRLYSVHSQNVVGQEGKEHQGNCVRSVIKRVRVVLMPNV